MLLCMRNIAVFLAMALALAGPAARAQKPSAAPAPRYERSINDGWTFWKEGSTATETVSLPHTWNAQDAADDTPGYWRGVGWYERTLTINDHLSGKKVFVRFDGANQEVDLFVNGVHAGNHKGGYTAFVFDVSGLVRGGANTFRIKVDNSPREDIPPIAADYTFFGGIYRPVSLLFVPQNHIGMEEWGSSGVQILTPEVTDAAATVQIATHLSLAQPAGKLFLEHTILSPVGTQVAAARQRIGKPSAQMALQSSLVVPHPQRWDVDSPQLYTAVTRLLDAKGNVLDQVSGTFGIRTFRFDPEKGFFLNGRPLKLMGTNRHQDYAGKGNALPDEMHLRDIRLLKEMGGNFLRISHYPQDPLVLAECDRLGILSCVEIPVINRIGLEEGFTENCVSMAREMVYQNINHPSLVAWAYMNEVLLDDAPWKNGQLSKEAYFGKVRDCARAIDGAIREADASRPTMLPCDANRNKYKESGITDIPDILGFNLYYGWYFSTFAKLGPALDKLHAMFPGKTLFVSEYGADADARLHSYAPECHDYTCEYSLLYHKAYYPVLLEKEYVAGAAVWNLCDFYSEARGFAVPHFNCKGLLTAGRVPKDSYWWYRVQLGKAPFLRIGGGHWPIRGGQESQDGVCVQPVEVYATASSVELSLNGKFLGSKPVEGGCAAFEVPFTAGENLLEACGSDGARDLQRIDFRMVPKDLSRFRELSVLMGTRRYFEDLESGQIWIPEQEYKPGSWGYVGGERMYQKNSSGLRAAFEPDIALTQLDPLFQTQRAGIEAFKADVPDGKYYVYLYFADLFGPYRGKLMLYGLGNDALPVESSTRVFSIDINGTTVLKDLNIATEYGYYTAVVKRFPVWVQNGEGLSVNFVPSEGLPILNAVRILKVE